MINSDKYIRACFKYALKHKFYIWVKLSKGSDTKPNGSKVHFLVTSNIYSYDDITSAINTVIDYFNE